MATSTASTSKAETQWIAITPRPIEARPSSSDGIDYHAALRQLFQGKAANDDAALFFKTPKGVALDEWNGATKQYIRKIIKGKDPFNLTDLHELVMVDWIATYDRERGEVKERGMLALYCVSRDFDNLTQDRALMTEAGKLFPGGTIRITIGNTFFYQSLLDIGHFLPAQASRQPPSGDSTNRTRNVVVDAASTRPQPVLIKQKR